MIVQIWSKLVKTSHNLSKHDQIFTCSMHRPESFSRLVFQLVNPQLWLLYDVIISSIMIISWSFDSDGCLTLIIFPARSLRPRRRLAWHYFVAIVNSCIGRCSVKINLIKIHESGNRFLHLSLCNWFLIQSMFLWLALWILFNSKSEVNAPISFKL